MEKRVQQPKACETYYKGCGKIDQLNRIRQANLMLEQKLGTTCWDNRACMTLFGMCTVDAYNLAVGCRGSYVDKRHFFETLAEQLIENTWDVHNLRMSTKKRSREAAMEPPPCAVDTLKFLNALTPTKRMKKKKPTQHDQGHCIECKKAMPTLVCRACQKRQDNPSKKQHWCCHDCFPKHMHGAHPDKIMAASP